MTEIDCEQSLFLLGIVKQAIQISRAVSGEVARNASARPRRKKNIIRFYEDHGSV